VISFFVKIHMRKPRWRSDSHPEGNTHNTEEVGWDIVVEDLQDDEGFEDHDDSDVVVQDIS